MYKLKKSGIRKLFAMLCVVFIFASGIYVSVPTFAQTEIKESTISVSSDTVEKGDKFSITVDIKNNPGIWGLKFKVGYDHSALTLTSAKNGNVFDNEDATLPSALDKEEFIYLAYLNSLKNNTTDGTILTLEFTAKNEAEFKPYIIAINVEQAINVNGDDIALKSNNGAVSVVKCVHVSDTKWESDADTHWHNCKYSDCKEKILKTVEKHTVEVIPAVSATCTEDGLTSGKKCSVCGYIIEKQQVVKATGHTSVKLKAVKATTKREGLTSGRKCSVCGETLVVQQVIPKITYKMKKAAKTNGKIKMYKKKKQSSKVVQNVKKGEKVTIVDMDKTWYLIKYKGKVGYVKSTSITWNAKVNVTKGNLRIRTGAGLKYPIISSRPNATKVSVVGRTANGWYKVQLKEKKKNIEGYMYSKYVK